MPLTLFIVLPHTDSNCLALYETVIFEEIMLISIRWPKGCKSFSFLLKLRRLQEGFIPQNESESRRFWLCLCHWFVVFTSVWVKELHYDTYKYTDLSLKDETGLRKEKRPVETTVLFFTFGDDHKLPRAAVKTCH